MLPFGPVPTISQSIARYFEGTRADDGAAAGLWKVTAEGKPPSPPSSLLPVAMEAVWPSVDPDDREAAWQGSAVFFGGHFLGCVEVESDGWLLETPLCCD